MKTEFKLSEKRWLIAMLKAHANHITGDEEGIDFCYSILDKLTEENLVDNSSLKKIGRFLRPVVAGRSKVRSLNANINSQQVKTSQKECFFHKPEDTPEENSRSTSGLKSKYAKAEKIKIKFDTKSKGCGKKVDCGFDRDLGYALHNTCGFMDFLCKSCQDNSPKTCRAVSKDTPEDGGYKPRVYSRRRAGSNPVTSGTSKGCGIYEVNKQPAMHCGDIFLCKSCQDNSTEPKQTNDTVNDTVKNGTCICGHKKKEHWNYSDSCDVSLSTTHDCLCKKFEVKK